METKQLEQVAVDSVARRLISYEEGYTEDLRRKWDSGYATGYFSGFKAAMKAMRSFINLNLRCYVGVYDGRREGFAEALKAMRSFISFVHRRP